MLKKIFVLHHYNKKRNKNWTLYKRLVDCLARCMDDDYFKFAWLWLYCEAKRKVRFSNGWGYSQNIVKKSLKRRWIAKKWLEV